MKSIFFLITLFVHALTFSQLEACKDSQKPEDEQPITITALSNLINTPEFYNANYRYIDELGGKGGRYSAGFLDTWLGETQILFPYDGLPIRVNQTDTQIIANNTNALYWMTLAMGQEYMNVDMQWMIGFGAKETFSGTPHAGPPFNTNAEGAYGPFEVELFTGLDRAISYPSFYPEYQTQLENALDINTSGIDPTQFMNHYIGADPTLLNESGVVGAYMLSITNFFAIYNWYSYAKDLCWHKVIDMPADPYYGLGAMAVTYNLGMFSANPVADTMNKDTYQATVTNANARDLLPEGNSFYRRHITEVIEAVVNRSVAANTDVSIALWDYQIEWSVIERFFLGEGGTISQQGHGGVLQHFEVDNQGTRQEVMNTLREAFDLLKGKAPSSTSNTISFRYDWLALLRTVKQHFSNQAIFDQPNVGDASLRINTFSDVGGCCIDVPVIEIEQACLDSETVFRISQDVASVNWEITNASDDVFYTSSEIEDRYSFTTEGDYVIEATITVEGETSVLSETINFGPDSVDLDVQAEFVGNDIVVTVVNGDSDYEYAIDTVQGPYQNTGRFVNVAIEPHVVYVKTPSGCVASVVVNPDANQETGLVIPEYFTPNGDGFHDQWEIKDPKRVLRVDSRVYVFNRFGKLLKQLDPRRPIWNGVYLNKNMPSTEYWYSIEYVLESRTKRITGSFSLIR
ncbi:T9SS type B sorting domain-containing protein [Aquimarina aquimarini]|uniref:T9SS type B sorting domain-containing protein n=1 Tax=Aquimarina aquimarini TaxID=1191734 RepID=UPI00131F1048|nr:T9SS type B sorting domain-containing protein [Aquimarina aquimarini]